MAVEEEAAPAAHGETEHEHQDISPEDIDETFVPVPREDVSGISLDGEGVVLVEDTWSVHWMNQAGVAVWESLDGLTSVKQIAAQLSETFHADPATLLTDVLEAVRGFGSAFLLEGVAPKRAFGGAPVDKLEVGAEIPAFELPDLDGQVVTMESLRGEQVLLVNWSPTCGFCKKIAPDFVEMDPALRERGVRPVFIAIGSAEANREVLDEFGLEVTMLLEGEEQAEFFAGMGTPAAYLVDENGMVAAELALGANEVPELLKSAAGLSGEEESDIQVAYVRRL